MENNLDSDMHEYINWGVQPPLSNFGGGVSENPLGELGFNMMKRKKNSTSCFKMLSQRVFSNGDVSACPCADYDGAPGLHLGNVADQTLFDMYNTEKMAKLLGATSTDELPGICRECTFHSPISDLGTNKLLQKKFAFATARQAFRWIMMQKKKKM